ncbi:hypothetical protein LINPERPRIM_LOCUS22202 [Linum perenne]
MRKFVREGLDIKVCIIRDKAVPCPKSISIFDEEEEHVVTPVPNRTEFTCGRTDLSATRRYNI